MISELVSELFSALGHTWRIGGQHQVPTTEDVQQVLDTAIGKVYDEPIGTQLQTGGLIIEKTDNGYDVYAYIGTEY